MTKMKSEINIAKCSYQPKKTEKLHTVCLSLVESNNKLFFLWVIEKNKSKSEY